MAAPFGNRNAAHDKPVENTLRRINAQSNGKELRRMCETMLRLAAEGSVAAATWVAERLEGKPKQQVEHSGELKENRELVVRTEVILARLREVATHMAEDTKEVVEVLDTSVNVSWEQEPSVASLDELPPGRHQPINDSIGSDKLTPYRGKPQIDTRLDPPTFRD